MVRIKVLLTNENLRLSRNNSKAMQTPAHAMQLKINKEPNPNTCFVFFLSCHNVSCAVSLLGCCGSEPKTSEWKKGQPCHANRERMRLVESSRNTKTRLKKLLLHSLSKDRNVALIFCLTVPVLWQWFSTFSGRDHHPKSSYSIWRPHKRITFKLWTSHPEKHLELQELRQYIQFDSVPQIDIVKIDNVVRRCDLLQIIYFQNVSSLLFYLTIWPMFDQFYIGR